ncbi:hypothetical protein SAMN05444487_101434 [Marininema mesophilum]|uniref:Uncharacterized protein n=1 Tax=Marininema mesophilum TaxID=1048340 RepID=A0A1H2REH0_9BACL|nr:hypothetical protein [Marininema mesophilum]SDW17214.1 hypothetical protein SAMN05444487_101434 [Marininema mesophilum]
MKNKIDYRELYDQLEQAVFLSYYELLDIAAHMGDRPALQKRIWKVANELMESR